MRRLATTTFFCLGALVGLLTGYLGSAVIINVTLIGRTAPVPGWVAAGITVMTALGFGLIGADMARWLFPSRPSVPRQ